MTSETEGASDPSAFVGAEPDLQDLYAGLTDANKALADRIAQLCELERLINQLIHSLPEGFAREQAAAKTFEAFAWMCETLRFDN